MFIFGFLCYAQDLMNNSPEVKFVSYLCNNSSTLESQNSIFRASNRSTALLMEKGIITSNLSSGMKMMETKFYSQDDSTVENTNLNSSNYDITAGSKQRDLWFDTNLLKRRKENNKSRIDLDSKIFLCFQQV